MTSMTTVPATAHPAATVIPLRNGADGCEVLLVQRNAQLSFHGGAWVFPGGRLDAGDYVNAGTDDVTQAARYAAVREAREEAGVIIAPDQLAVFSHWITPAAVPKRFDTWFFVAPVGSGRVQVDGNEIRAHRWLSPVHAIAAQRAGEIDLPPPTFVTLDQLAGLDTVADVLAAVARRPVETYLPRVRSSAAGPCTVYHGDVAYDDDDADRPGPRHRLVMAAGGWRYERTGEWRDSDTE